MVLSKKDKPALVLIDIQKGFEDVAYWGGQRNNPQAEENAGKLLRLWRQNGLPVFHIKHCSTNPKSPLVEGKPGNGIQDVVSPIEGEPIIKKSVNSAFIGTNFRQQLDVAHVRQLVFVGLTTDHCVSTTIRMAGNYNFEAYVVEDATATFNKKGFNGKNYSAELIHETALASLNEEFATVVTMEQVMEVFSKAKG